MKENTNNDKPVSKDENTMKDDLTGKTLFGKYKVLKKIGDGSQSTIYSGENIKTGEGVAIKAEKQDVKHHLLEEEMKILSILKNHEGIVDIIACGRKGHNFILIEKLLGVGIGIGRVKIPNATLIGSLQKTDSIFHTAALQREASHGRFGNR